MLKKCFVSSCSNNSQDSPSKLFISVPKPDNRRKLWFKSIGANYRSSRRVYCCEDHFNLPIDAKNWIYFKTVGGRIMLHEHVVPHLNLEANSQSVEFSQLSNSEKKLQQENIEQMKSALKQDTLAEPEQLFHNTREELVKTTESPILTGFLIENNKCFLSHHNDYFDSNLLYNYLEKNASEFQNPYPNNKVSNEESLTKVKKRKNSSTCVKNQISDHDNFNRASKYMKNLTACGNINYTKRTVRIKKRRKSPIRIKPDFSDDDATIPSYGRVENSPSRGTEKPSICMNNNDNQNDEPNFTISSVEFAHSSSSKDITVYKMSSPELEKENFSIFVKSEFLEYDENNFEIISVPENIQDSSSIEIINEENTVSRKKQSPISFKIELEMNPNKVKRTKYLVCIENEVSKDDAINFEHIQNSFVSDNLIKSEKIDVKEEQSLVCVKNEVCEENVNNSQLITNEQIKLEQQLNTELIIKDENLISCEEINSQKNTYTCSTCDKIFYNKTQLKLHIKSHQKFICDICDKIFTFKHHLTTHKRTHNDEKSYVHTSKRPYSCNFSDEAFAKKCYLISHRRSHTGEIPYKCDVCGKYFSQHRTLKVHKRQHISAYKRQHISAFSCDVCDKTFYKRHSLVVHKIQHIKPNYGGY